MKKANWWRWLFVVLGLVMATLYLRDAFGEGPLISNTIKGSVWVALVVLVIVLELLEKRKLKTPVQGKAEVGKP
jgi:hypothetical protein